jgi:single stranded DNA-binding protein
MLKAEIIGNLGHDATTRQINGKDYVCFDVEHGERQNGERRTVWISILWAGNGGNLLQYLRKGATVFVRGDFSAKLYTNRAGNVNISQSIMAREVQMCSFAEREQTQAHNGYIQAPQAQYSQHPTSAPLHNAQAAPAANLDNPDDDRPF